MTEEAARYSAAPTRHYTLAIDPGPKDSAFAMFHTQSKNLIAFGKMENDLVKKLLDSNAVTPNRVVIEEIRSYGMSVGMEVFDTVRYTGRLQERAESLGQVVALLPRLAVKLHICKSPKANDASIRQALIDKYGPGKDMAIGTKKAPGPLYGVKADVWSAIAIGLTDIETREV